MSYTYMTGTQFNAALARRLQDAGNVFWTSAELTRWRTQALRVWSTVATYWRDKGTFNTAASTPFYDITTTAGSSAQMSALLGMTVTDQDLVTDLCYALVEAQPTFPATWNGTDQFDLTSILGAIQRRRDQFLSETGAVLTRLVTAVGAPANGLVVLADNVLDVRRVAWKDAATGAVTPLYRADELQADYGLPQWSVNPATPSLYSTIATPPLTVQLIPVPAAPGSVDILSVNAGATLDGSGVLLGIPDDFAPTIFYGALADLLGRDGQCADPDRAAYCESRWQQGCELARINPTAILAEIQGTDNLMDDLWSIDTAMSTWQSTTSAAQPTVVATAGRNLVALAPMPDAGPYSCTLNVVRNAPIPANDAAYLQLGRDAIDALLDYAEHVAMFKVGGAEWHATDRAYTNLLRLATQYNEKLRASSMYKEILWPTAKRQSRDVPRRQPDVADTEVRA